MASSDAGFLGLPAWRLPDCDSALNALAPTEALLDQLLAASEALGGAFVLEFGVGGKRRALVVNTLEDIERLLLKYPERSVKGIGIERVRLLLPHGSFTSEGTAWEQQRALARPTVGRRALSFMESSVERALERALARWEAACRAGAPLNLQEECAIFTSEAILYGVLGEDYDELTAHAGAAYLRASNPRSMAMLAAVRDLAKKLAMIVDRRRTNGELSSDGIGVMLRGVPPQHTSSEAVAAEALTFIVAGLETTANALCSFLTILATLRIEPGRASSEVIACSDSVPRREARIETLVDRVLEIFPPGWIFTRRLTEPLTLAQSFVNPGTDIIVSPLLYNRRESGQFAKIPVLDATRLCEEPHDSEACAPVAVAFGLGRRRCSGQYLARHMLRSYLVAVLRRHAPRALGSDVHLCIGVNLRLEPQCEIIVERV